MTLDADMVRYRVSHGPDRIRADNILLDRVSHRLFIDDVPQDLPKKEYELLELLMLHRGKALTRQILLDCLWTGAVLVDDKTLDVHILRLRRRIERSPHDATYIHTLRGYGYLFEPRTVSHDGTKIGSNPAH